MRTQLVSTVLRVATRPSVAVSAARVAPAFARPSSSHAQETFESFSERYVNFFQNAEDLFEVQRGLNNCFAHDLVPSTSVVEAAVRAARRVNDYSTAVRVFEGIREKVENKQQYQAYLDELKGVREELGVFTLWVSLYIVVFMQNPFTRHFPPRGTLPIIKYKCSHYSRSFVVYSWTS